MSLLVESKDEPQKGNSFRWELVVNFEDGGFMELHRYYLMPGHGEPLSLGGLCTVQLQSGPRDIVHNHYVSRGETPKLDRGQALKAIEIMTSPDKEHAWDVWHVIRDSEAA